MTKTTRTIGLVAPYFPPEVGGANTYCYELAKALAAKGFAVHVFSKEGALEDPAYTLHPILKLRLDEDLALLHGFNMDVWHSLFFFHAPLALQHENVFVTGHGDDFFSFRIRYNLPGRSWLTRNLLWRFGTGIRNRLDGALHRAELRYNRRRYREAIVRARQLIAVSSFSKDRLCEQFPSARLKTTVIPPGVSERFFCTNGEAHEPRFFLTVTRLDEHDRIKNIHGVIGALAMLKDRYPFRYVVVAGAVSGRYRDDLERMIVDSGLRERVSIEGRKSVEELVAYYRRADLFLLVSYAEPQNFEGFGIVFLEANAAGVPVLTSRQGGMADYVEPGVNGFYVDEPSAAGIRAALERYLEGDIHFDRDRVREAPEPYRWSRIADRVLEVYERHGT
jgi:glycosyltransferase involved in cell wall biosynthesis